MDEPSWMRWVEMGLLLLIAGCAGVLLLVHRLVTTNWWTVWVKRGQAGEAEAPESPTEENLPDGATSAVVNGAYGPII